MPNDAPSQRPDFCRYCHYVNTAMTKRIWVKLLGGGWGCKSCIDNLTKDICPKCNGTGYVPLNAGAD